MLIGGRIGNILFAIPLVIVSVIVASLVESFFVLPGHLRHSFLHAHKVRPASLRARLDRGFAYFRDRLFRPVARLAIHNRFTTVAAAIALLVVAVGLLQGGRLKFPFFPRRRPRSSPPTPPSSRGPLAHGLTRFSLTLSETLNQTERELGQGDLVKLAVAIHGAKASAGHGGGRGGSGEQLGALEVELLPPDARSVRNDEFMRAWRERIRLPAGI